MKYDDVTQSNKLRHSITSRGTSIPLSLVNTLVRVCYEPKRAKPSKILIGY